MTNATAGAFLAAMGRQVQLPPPPPAQRRPRRSTRSGRRRLGSVAVHAAVGRSGTRGVLGPDAAVLWWCATEFDDQPLCWRLLDEAGGTARFPGLRYDDAGAPADDAPADDAPAGASATTLLRDATGLLEVRDGVFPRGDGVVLIRLLRRRPGPGGFGSGPSCIEHELRLGGFDGPAVTWSDSNGTAKGTASGTLGPGAAPRSVQVRGGRQAVCDRALVSHLDVDDQS